MLGLGVRRIALLLLITALASCSKHEEAPVEPPTVSVSKAARGDLFRDIILTAEFKPFQSVDVMAKLAGYVKSINVDVGPGVQAGQLIATLEIPEMADDMARATAALEGSQSEVAREKDELQRA